MKKQKQPTKMETERTIDLELLQPAAFNRKPLWRAADHYWPSIDPVEFRADDQGNGNIMRIAARLLDESEQDSSVD